MFRGFLSLLILHLIIFDAVIQRRFAVVLKYATGDLCRTFVDIIIIQFYTFSCNRKTEMDGWKPEYLRTKERCR